MALLKLISDAKLLTVRADLISERLYKLTMSNKAILCKASEPSERKSIKSWAFLATLFMMFQLTTGTIYYVGYSQLSIYLAIRLSIIYITRSQKASAHSLWSVNESRQISQTTWPRYSLGCRLRPIRVEWVSLGVWQYRGEGSGSEVCRVP